MEGRGGEGRGGEGRGGEGRGGREGRGGEGRKILTVRFCCQAIPISSTGAYSSVTSHDLGKHCRPS